jgi:hypothetical protein
VIALVRRLGQGTRPTRREGARGRARAGARIVQSGQLVVAIARRGLRLRLRRREPVRPLHVVAEVLVGEDDARVRVSELRGQARDPGVSERAADLGPELRSRDLVWS